uniref:C-type lectin n=1 Tax=Hirondellea gigas TaxID=1518452 RepID=A0A2P2HYH3_9CRUS
MFSTYVLAVFAAVASSVMAKDIDLKVCMNRHQNMRFEGHAYSFSLTNMGSDLDKDGTLHPRNATWLEARSFCLKNCMIPLSIQTEVEFSVIKSFMKKYKVPAVWTGGRICDWHGCAEKLPLTTYGWFWAGHNTVIPATDVVPQGWSESPWSRKGHFGVRQPDNAQYEISGVHELCLAIFDDAYEDGVKWHDVACYHEMPFVCEDSSKIIKAVKEKYGLDL